MEILKWKTREKQICRIVPLLLVLPVACGQTVDLRTMDFIHYTQTLHWSEAQAYCRKYHTDLVTIASEGEIQRFFRGQGWIGLYRNNSNSPWIWSRRNEPANFKAWDTNEPTADKNCAFKYHQKLIWNTGDCNDGHTFMCYDEMLLVTENKTWEDALNYCRAVEARDPSQPATDYNNNAFDLVTVVSQDDYTTVREKMLDATTDEVWTGLRYLAGQWVWVGGESVQYKDIESCPAQNLCGILVKNSTAPLQTRNCQLEMNFVCYKKPDGL